ncbi:YadA-like family protein (plasmid) [Arsenophonus nasoniae]|uniref:Adhesin YadA n=1 Tax=Arsenophonus nasoniae TaxID=638 RepID=A0A4P7L930_9GAMM|nr:YadA-like family protein [Arsenophonus nasoniae]QBY45602.1 Adhesin YadA [Arsenophonus nasoniae]WGM07868.1 YadA-like family protein [Arsenophonus nasoniae]WGM12984.1 YadA-like family protein [Arsenophonus nasoniae]WGM17450.1 YadA-like family protein [Arsenophonus nasoniae]
MKTTSLKLAVLVLTVTLAHPVISLAGTATREKARATGVDSTATGSNSKASGTRSTANGDYALASGDNSTAIGSQAKATGKNTVAIGSDSVVDRDNTVSVGQKGVERQVTNVADGTEDTDGTNVRQVNNAKREAINTANAYTDSRFNQFTHDTSARINQLDNKIDRVEKQANAGIAGVTAIASIPYSTSENFSFGMGVGHYQNGKAIAAGAQYKIADNANVRVNIAWDNTDNASVGAGLAIGW